MIKPSIQELYGKLNTKVGLCLQRDFIPVVIGGSRDLFQAVADAYLSQSAKLDASEGEHKVTFLSLNHSLDMQPLLSDSLSHQTSVRRYLAEKMRDNYSMWTFGLDGRRVAQQDLEYFESKVDVNCRRSVWLSQIKREGALTIWNEMLDSLVTQAKEAGDGSKHMVHISINMEVIEGLKGVSTNCLSGGIQTEDAVEMCYQAGLKLGRANLLKSIDLTEYNPYVED